MKHLRKIFEEKSDEALVTTVVFGGDEEYVLACYVDGDLEFYGDHYHDKIQDKIEGFILGLKWIKENYVYPLTVKTERFDCSNDDMNRRVADFGEDPPKELSGVERD